MSIGRWGYMKLLQNKVVFITEADNPSGRALITRLASEGARFLLNSASNGQAIQSELERCQSEGASALVIQINACKSSEVNEALSQAAEQLGTVDVLIHNNNLVEPGSVAYGDEEWFKRILNANAKSAFICTQAVGKQMVSKNYGKVVYISSIHAEKPTGSSFAYSASKGAVKMLSREAALKLGRHGVTVNTIEFGPVEGDNEVFHSEISSLYEDYTYKVPDAVLGTHEDLAELALFLSTDQSRYMNGADIRLDGGFLMHYLDLRMKKPAAP